MKKKYRFEFEYVKERFGMELVGTICRSTADPVYSKTEADEVLHKRPGYMAQHSDDHVVYRVVVEEKEDEKEDL
jgi:hypothetical protein